MKITVDFSAGTVSDGEQTHELSSADGFALVSRAWLRAGWDAKYVYSFSWFGRPIIQLPEDIIRIQEVIYGVRPDIIIETGVAHGGSLVFYASLFEAMGHGHVVGVDIEIRPHNRSAIEGHQLAKRITLIEGSSTDVSTVQRVKACVPANSRTLVLLDSNHTRAHVLRELELYSGLVTTGSYIVAMDGIMRELGNAPRTIPSWREDNPVAAVEEFLRATTNFVLEEPRFPFNEGAVRERVTYWPSAFLRRVA